MTNQKMKIQLTLDTRALSHLQGSAGLKTTYVGVVDLYAVSLRSGKYLGCLTAGCSYGGWVNAWFLSLKPDL